MKHRSVRRDSLVERQAVIGLKYVSHGDGTGTYYKDSSLSLYSQGETPKWANSTLRNKLVAKRQAERRLHTEL